MAEQDDLIDYSSDEEQVQPIKPAAKPQKKTPAAKKTAAAAAVVEEEKTEAGAKGSYVGIHATGFRDFLLKPELLNAIGECGFEHPSEGKITLWLVYAYSQRNRMV